MEIEDLHKNSVLEKLDEKALPKEAGQKWDKRDGT
jgi:hypothetical protein